MVQPTRRTHFPRASIHDGTRFLFLLLCRCRSLRGRLRWTCWNHFPRRTAEQRERQSDQLTAEKYLRSKHAIRGTYVCNVVPSPYTGCRHVSTLLRLSSNLHDTTRRRSLSECVTTTRRTSIEKKKKERGFEKVTATNRERRERVRPRTHFLSPKQTFELVSHLFPPQEPRQDAATLVLLAASHLRRLPTPPISSPHTRTPPLP